MQKQGVKSMKLLILPLMIFSLSACSNPAPNSDQCVLNVPNMHLNCRNLSRDYDSEGRLLPSSTPTIKPITGIQDIDKHIVIDPNSFENIKIFTNQTRAYIKRLEADLAACEAR